MPAKTKRHMAEHDPQSHPEMLTMEIRAITSTSLPALKVNDLCYHAAQDPEYQQLQKIILKGFPQHRNQFHESCRHYWNVRKHLSIDDSLIVHGCRLLMPTVMRRQVLTNLHELPQGIVRTKQRARLTVYWPG